jgi:cysteine desulfurase
MDDALEGLASLIGLDLASDDRLIATSGGTESNNWAIFGLLAHPEPGEIIASPFEHPSVVAAIGQLMQKGWTWKHLPVDRRGVAQWEELDRLHSPRTRLVCLMAANNETGVLQPVAEAAAWCQARALPFHTDAVQWAGKLPVDFRSWGVSTMSLAPHKFYGPRGLGLLAMRPEVHLSPMFWGGFQQQGWRPGTENVPLLVASHVALKSLVANLPRLRAQLESLRTQFEESLRSALPEIVIHGEEAPRLPQTSCVGFPDVDGRALKMSLDLANLACSIGSACASGSIEASPVLAAMKVPHDLALASIRFSFGIHNTAADVDNAIERLVTCYQQVRASRSSTKE